MDGGCRILSLQTEAREQGKTTTEDIGWIDVSVVKLCSLCHTVIQVESSMTFVARLFISMSCCAMFFNVFQTHTSIQPKAVAHIPLALEL